MLIVRPDFDRRIDLPGAGPCPRPVDIDQSKTRFSDLVSLRVYSFAQGMVIDGEAEGDEVFIVLMRGAATVGVTQDDRQAGLFALGTEGGARAVYLPPHASYQLTASSDCDVAYARVLPCSDERPAARDFVSSNDQLTISGYATGMDLTLSSLASDRYSVLFKRLGGSSERFVHVRSSDGGIVTLLEEQLGDWDTVALSDDEHPTLKVEKGTVAILTVSASVRMRNEKISVLKTS